jgi:hypothetical protein
MQLVFRQARMEGFLAGQDIERVSEYDDLLLRLYRSGKLNARAHIVKGLEQAPAALHLIFSGQNTGKLIVEVSTPPELHADRPR